MNAIVQFQPQQPVQQFTMSEMERVALAIAKGGLFGSNDPNAVLTLCMVAAAEGKHPGLVMQQYHLINGKPAKKAEAMLVDFLASGGRVEWHALTDEMADATFTHPQGGSARIAWDMVRAKKAQLTSPMWGKYPRQMLRSRVVSEGVRTVFPGATSGMYVPEEIMDFEPAKATPPAPAAQRARDLQAEKPALADQRSPGRDKAQEWVASHIEAIDLAGSAEDLDAIIANGRKAVAKLEREHPDLHGQVVAAETDRGRYFAEQTSGPSDTDRGEQHSATTTDEQTATALIASIAGEKTTDALDSFMARTRDQLDALPEDLQERVRGEYYTRFEALGGGK